MTLKPLLAMALRRARPGSGSMLTMSPRQELPKLGLVRLLGQAWPWAIAGGRATALYMTHRLTPATDVLVMAEDLPAIEARLRQQGGQCGGMLSIGGSSWQLADGSVLDLLAPDYAWVSEALAKPERVNGDAYLALPWLVLMKLIAARAQDLADITRMLGMADPEAMAAVRAVVERHRPADLADLDSMRYLSLLEHQPPPAAGV